MKDEKNSKKKSRNGLRQINSIDSECIYKGKTLSTTSQLLKRKDNSSNDVTKPMDLKSL